MKKSIFIALTLGVLAVSCNRDDNNGNPIVTQPKTTPEAPANPLVGKWEQVKTIIHIDDDKEEQVTECQKKSTLEFTNNGDFIKPNYAEKNNVCELLPNPDNSTEKYEYNATEKTVTYRNVTYNIVKVDAQELHLKANGATTVYKKL